MPCHWMYWILVRLLLRQVRLAWYMVYLVRWTMTSRAVLTPLLMWTIPQTRRVLVCCCVSMVLVSWMPGLTVISRRMWAMLIWTTWLPVCPSAVRVWPLSRLEMVQSVCWWIRKSAAQSTVWTSISTIRLIWFVPHKRVSCSHSAMVWKLCSRWVWTSRKFMQERPICSWAPCSVIP